MATTITAEVLASFQDKRGTLTPLQYGRDMESEALKKYVEYQNNLSHININIQAVGLIVSQEKVFLGASPDSFVSCDCCGDGVVEIKCPESLRPTPTNPTPSVLSAHCLTKVNGTMHLSMQHNYYSQVQGLLAICGKLCDFVVYNRTDIFVERISFNDTYWMEMQDCLVDFFITYMIPELVTHVNRPSHIVQRVKQKYTVKCSQVPVADQICADVAIHDVACNEVIGIVNNDFSGACLESTITVLEDVSISQDLSENVNPKSYCPCCKKLCEDEARQFIWQSILCETCGFWFHMKCVKMTRKKVNGLEGKEFLCVSCKLAMKVLKSKKPL